MPADTDRSSDRLRALDHTYVWHPFTPMADWLAEDPLIIERGEGSYLIDVNGVRYLDGVSSLWVTVHGHRKRRLDDAIRAQLDNIAHTTQLGLASVPALELAARLIAIAPEGLTRVFYSDSGSTSVEIALKMAFQYWQQRDDPALKKTKFIAFRDAYHGDTLGSVSVGGIDLFHAIYKPLLFKALKTPAPYCYRCELNETYPACDIACANALEELVAAHHEELVGLVIEPLVMGAAGMITAPDGFLKRARDICDRYDILLIADEVAVGFGRTGKMFACEWEGVTPDLMCLAKGITGGYLPLAATIATDRIFDAFRTTYAEQRTFFHGHTYTGNPLACAAALANLQVFDDEHVLETLGPKIALLAKELERFRSHPHVGDVRQRGMMAGIELVADKETKEPFPHADKTAIRIITEARARGLIIRPLGDVLVLMPPLSVSHDELTRIVRITYESLCAALGS